MDRSFEAAVLCLNSRKAAPKPSLDEMRGSDDMLKWLERVGHSMDEINGLNIIHVSGTNGKGSVCAFTSSFLQTYGQMRQRPRTIGLYTSPHIQSVRDRIQINNRPISASLFSKRFFEVWDKLPREASAELDVPRYLQLLALLSYHVFICERVDVAIYETHLGGEYDSTNIVTSPLATAITTVAEDHMHLLGPTIETIAWHKSGIFKSGTPAFSSPQSELVADVLRQRAADKSVTLEFVEFETTLEGITYSWLPDVQKMNCSLALALANTYMRQTTDEAYTPIEITKLLAACETPPWPGRFHCIHVDGLKLYIDGAHNESGIVHAVDWFANAISKNVSHVPTRTLIFSQFSQRDGNKLLTCVVNCLQEHKVSIHNVIFTSYNERKDGTQRIGCFAPSLSTCYANSPQDKNLQNRYDPEVLKRYQKTWKDLGEQGTVSNFDTIEEALKKAKELGRRDGGAEALVLGSLKLVEGILCMIERSE